MGLTCVPGGRGDLRWRHAADNVVSVDNAHVPACEQQMFVYFCHVMLQLIATFSVAWQIDSGKGTTCYSLLHKLKATTDQRYLRRRKPEVYTQVARERIQTCTCDPDDSGSGRSPD